MVHGTLYNCTFQGNRKNQVQRVKPCVELKLTYKTCFKHIYVKHKVVAPFVPILCDVFDLQYYNIALLAYNHRS